MSKKTKIVTAVVASTVATVMFALSGVYAYFLIRNHLKNHYYKTALRYDKEQNYKKAAEFYDRACKMGVMHACYELGLHYEKGDGVTRDYKRAVRLFTEACNNRVADACYHLGSLYYKGEGVDQNYQQASELFSKACNMNSTSGCYYAALANIQMNGYTKTALNLLNKACNLNSAPACGKLGRWYADAYYAYKYSGGVFPSHIYKVNEKPQKVLTRALALLNKACNMNDQLGCYKLGKMYYDGNIVTRDYHKAIKFWQKACNLKGKYMSESCYNVAKVYYKGDGVLIRYKKAAKFFQKVCSNGKRKYALKSCNILGYLYQKGYGVSQSYHKATELYQKACDMGNVNGCFNLGLLYANGEGVPQNYQEAAKLYKKACDVENPSTVTAYACNNLGILYSQGEGVPQNYQEAAKLFQKACNMDDELACNNLNGLITFLMRRM